MISCLILIAANPVAAQEVLPGITVKDFDGKIVVSWKNEYRNIVSTINIQRSFDSTKNYSTIGTVLNPQNLENGYADNKPPYNKMYYRLFISFEGGSYVFSSIARPVKIKPAKDTGQGQSDPNVKFAWQVAPSADTVSEIPADSLTKEKEPLLPGIKIRVNPNADFTKKLPPKRDSIALKNNPEIITYPSQRIFTSRDNNLVIHLTDVALNKYNVKFYDDNMTFLFELTKLKEEFLIIEKVNFVHAGWFHFELFENGRLLEKNKFYIGKDSKSNNESNRRPGSN